MPVIPEAVIEDVRARTDIVQVIGDRVPLKRAGAAWKACCPFHNEKTPSFTVNPQRQSFKCFGCGEGGDVFKFLMKHDGMSFVDAVRYLAEKCGVEVVAEEDDGRTARAKRLYQINAEFAAFCHRCLLKTSAAAGARASSRAATASRPRRWSPPASGRSPTAPAPPRTCATASTAA